MFFGDYYGDYGDGESLSVGPADDAPAVDTADDNNDLFAKIQGIFRGRVGVSVSELKA